MIFAESGGREHNPGLDFDCLTDFVMRSTINISQVRNDI